RREVAAVVVLVGRLLAVARAVGEEGAVHRERIFDQDTVEIERDAGGGRLAVAAADAGGKLGGVAEAGAGGAGVDEAGGGAEGEEEGVGAAVDVDAVGVVGIEGDVGLEEIARAIRRSEAADARGAVGVAAGIAGADVAAAVIGGAGEVADEAADLG